MLSGMNGLCYSFSAASVPAVVGFIVTSQVRNSIECKFHYDTGASIFVNLE